MSYIFFPRLFFIFYPHFLSFIVVFGLRFWGSGLELGFLGSEFLVDGPVV